MIEQRLAGFMAEHGLSRDRALPAFMASRQPSGRFVAIEGAADLAAFLCGRTGAISPARRRCFLVAIPEVAV